MIEMEKEDKDEVIAVCFFLIFAMMIFTLFFMSLESYELKYGILVIGFVLAILLMIIMIRVFNISYRLRELEKRE
jgi:hypothetical protein